jgi:MoaA/NifB/PqqE/SkfB family radical SAM enzyme
MSQDVIVQKTKYFLSSHLSPFQKRVVRFFLNTAKNPLQLKRHLNMYQYEKYLHQSTIVSYVPPVFGATITEQCNLRCPTCLYLLENENKFHNSYITPEKFGDLLKRTNPHKKAEVIFFTGGEPLLHPNIGELISIAKKCGFIPRLSTNGILIEKKIDELTEVDYINVSMDSYDYDSFSRYRGGTHHQFDQIKKGICKLKDCKKKFSLSFVLSSANVHEVDRMIAFAEELLPPSIYFHNINPHGCTDYAPLTLQDPATREFLEKITKKRNYPFDIYISAIFDLKSELFKKARCIQPWYYFCFNPDGDIAYCCHLSHDPNIGNIFKGNFLNSPALIEFRKGIMNGQIPASCLYCQRRFMESEFGKFNASLGTWFINKEYPDYFNHE